MATEPRVAQVRHAVNAVRLTHHENVQCGARNVINVEIKTILVHVVGQSKRPTGQHESTLWQEHHEMP